MKYRWQREHLILVPRCTHTSGPPHRSTLHDGASMLPQRGQRQPNRIWMTCSRNSGWCFATEDDHAIASRNQSETTAPNPTTR